MRIKTALILPCLFLFACTKAEVTPQAQIRKETPQKQPISSTANRFKDADFVDILSVAPNVQIDMRYATANNFLGKAVYPKNAPCLLRYAAAKRLALVQQSLEAQGLGLKVYDCHRPLDIQKQMWEIKPDSNYVADPAKGSRHNRGMAVDLTLVKNGVELPMPSQFDEFSARSHRNYQGGDSQALHNREVLEDAMIAQGFTPLATEWWHFDVPGWQEYSFNEQQ